METQKTKFRTYRQSVATLAATLVMLAGWTALSPPPAWGANSDVVINELLVDPETDDVLDEYVELINIGADSVNLSGWTLSDGIDFVFPAGTSIQPNGYLVVARSVANIQDYYKISNLVGDWTGDLANTGETIVLTDSGGTMIDTVTYGAAAPWPEGEFASIELIDPYSDNDAADNWAYHSPPEDGGSPGKVNSVFDPQISIPDGWGVADIGAVGLPGSLREANGTFALKASGSNIWGTADECFFAYRYLKGTGTIIARITSIGYVHDQTIAGLMIRNSLDPGSPNLRVSKAPNKGNYGLAGSYRIMPDGGSEELNIAGELTPTWLKMERATGYLQVWYAEDEGDWKDLATLPLPLNDDTYIGLVLCSRDNSKLASAEFDNVTLTGTFGDPPAPPVIPDPTPAPEGWATLDIGQTATGAFFEQGAGYEIRGDGADIWGRSDGFRFAFKKLTGDGMITAKLAQLSAPHEWTKAGLMIRKSLAPDSQNFFAMKSPDGGTDRVRIQYRQARSADTIGEDGTALDEPMWLRLVRNGDEFAGYASPDGATGSWEQIATSQTVGMDEDVYIGLAITSHQSGTPATAIFEDISLTGDIQPPTGDEAAYLEATPAPFDWQATDIGATALDGRLWYDLDTEAYTLLGAGDDIWGVSDGFLFAYKQLNGDGSISARVLNLDPTHTSAKAGVMIRESMEPASKHAMTNLRPAGGLEFLRRVQTGGATTDPPADGTVVPIPGWIRLTRTGNQFVSEYSLDGLDWTEYASETITMPAQVLIGLTACSHGSFLTEAAFANVTLTGDITLAPGAPPAAMAMPVQANFGVVAREGEPTILSVSILNGADDSPLNITGLGEANLGEAFKIHSVIRNGYPVLPPYNATLRANAVDVLVINLTVDPIVSEGDYSGSLSIESDDPNAPLTIPVSATVAQTRIYHEGFEGLPLQGAVDETDYNLTGWTHTAPEGWTIDNSGMNTNMGTTEWRGWSFTNIVFWLANGLDGRESTLTNGTFALAESDRYENGGATEPFDSILISPPITMPAGAQAYLTFMDDYQHRDVQAGWLLVSVDGGADQILHTYGAGQPRNQLTQHLINPPDTASDYTLQFKWRLEANNGWWWAIDEVKVFAAGLEEPPIPTPLPTPTPTPVLTPTPTEPTPTEPTPIEPTPTATPTTTPTDEDQDGDGLPDSCETTAPDILNLMVLTNAWLPDSDGDGLLDGEEAVSECESTLPTRAQTNPRNADTDGDGYTDGMEVLILSSDPLDAQSPDPAQTVDGDGDGLPASLDPDDANPDFDMDGFSDGYETQSGTDPNDPDSVPALGDINDDGSANNLDAIVLFNWTLGNPAPANRLDLADCVADGQVNNLDAIVLFNWTLKNVELLPVMN